MRIIVPDCKAVLGGMLITAKLDSSKNKHNGLLRYHSNVCVYDYFSIYVDRIITPLVAHSTKCDIR